MEGKVSVIMPCYNAGKHISEAIDSVLSQTYGNLELIIVDDNSTDNSVSIIEKYAERDDRIKFFSTKFDSGSAAMPRNVGIQHATGEYIAFLDADDVWVEDKLEQQLPLFSRQDCAIVFSDYYKIDTEGSPVANDRLVKAPATANYEQMLSGNVIGCLTAIYSVKNVGKRYFKEIGHEDYLYWLDILKGGYVACKTEKPEAYYRTGGASLSSNKLKAMMWTWHILREEEKLSLLRAFKHFTSYAVKGVLKSSK